MKNILFLFTALICTSIYAQEYEIGAVMTTGQTLKMPGKITFTDSLMVLELVHNGSAVLNDYDIINERNGVIYVSDGTETYKTIISENSGKKRGFKHSHMMSFEQPNGMISVYYIKPSI